MALLLYLPWILSSMCKTFYLKKLYRYFHFEISYNFLTQLLNQIYMYILTQLHYDKTLKSKNISVCLKRQQAHSFQIIIQKCLPQVHKKSLSQNFPCRIFIRTYADLLRYFWGKNGKKKIKPAGSNKLQGPTFYFILANTLEPPLSKERFS